MLGGFEIVEAGQVCVALNTPAIRALLVYLILNRATPQPRQRVAFALYPDNTERQSQTNLRKVLHRLRAVWPTMDAHIGVDALTLQWRPESCEIDADAFECALREQRLADALSIYAGDLLPDDTAEWIVVERERLRGLYLTALHTHALALETTDARRALEFGERLVRAEPLREDAYRLLMRLHARAGDEAGIAHAFQRCEQVLREELGIAPSATTCDARADAFAFTRTAPRRARAGTRGAPEFPAPFVGRARDLQVLAERLKDPACRLITIHAPGGMGKTRLMNEAVRAHAASFADGAVWVSFEDTREPRLVVPRIAEAIGLPLNATDTPLDQLCAHLRDASLLLGLDNVETVAACAPELAALLKSCPGLRMLTTAREPLRISWEWIHDLAGLRDDAIAVFVQAARRVDQSFICDSEAERNIARIAVCVEGMPLAIELSAAWLREYPLAMIASEVERNALALHSPFVDTPERQQSVHGVLAWTWARLSDAERDAMRRLSVFRAGVHLDAAAAMLTQTEVQTEALLRRLSTRLLIRRDAVDTVDGRYRMHSLIQQFALQDLATRGDADETRARHFDVMLALVLKAEAQFASNDLEQKRAVSARLRDESDNVRAAIEWSRDAWPEAGLDLAQAMFDFWLQSGHVSEARHVFETILARTPAAPSSTRARALTRLGVLAMFAANYSESLALLERARITFVAIGDARGSARPLCNMVIAARHLGDYARTLALSQEVLRLLNAEHTDPGPGDALIPVSVVHLNSAFALNALGEFDAARARMSRAMALFKLAPDAYHFHTEQASVGALLLFQRDYRGALATYLKCIAYCLPIGARAVLVVCFDGCGGIAAETGQAEVAAQLFGLAHRMRNELGIALPRANPMYERNLAAARAALSPVAFDAAWTRGLQSTDADGVTLAHGIVLAER